MRPEMRVSILFQTDRLLAGGAVLDVFIAHGITFAYRPLTTVELLWGCKHSVTLRAADWRRVESRVRVLAPTVLVLNVYQFEQSPYAPFVAPVDRGEPSVAESEAPRLRSIFLDKRQLATVAPSAVRRKQICLRDLLEPAPTAAAVRAICDAAARYNREYGV